MGKKHSQSQSSLIINSVLFAAGAVTTMTGSVIAPVFPEMLKELNLDPQWAGILVSVHSITIMLSIPFWGILADSIGKTKILILSLVGFSFFGILGAFLNSFFPLLITRSCLGVVSAGISAACISILSAIYQGEARLKILGYATSAMTTATIFMPLLGGLLGSWEWRWAFYLYGIAIPVALLAAFVLPHKKINTNSQLDTIINSKLLAELTSGPIIRSLLTIILASAILYCLIIYTPVYLEQKIQSDVQFNGMVLAASAIAIAIMSASGASWAHKFMGNQNTIVLGFSLMAVSLTLIPMLINPQLLLLVAFIFGCGFGIILPNIYNNLAESTSSEFRSTIIAIGTGCNSLGQFICPLILGFVWKNFDIVYTFYLSGLLAAIVAIYWLVEKYLISEF